MLGWARPVPSKLPKKIVQAQPLRLFLKNKSPQFKGVLTAEPSQSPLSQGQIDRPIHYHWLKKHNQEWQREGLDIIEGETKGLKVDMYPLLPLRTWVNFTRYLQSTEDKIIRLRPE